MIYFTADTHFADPRIDLLNRPFESVDEMNDTIYNNLYDTLKEDDILYHLGDVSSRHTNLYLQLGWVERFRHLKCKQKYLILGNHDIILTPGQYEYYGNFKVIPPQSIDIDKYSFYCIHTPVDASESDFNLVGHIHGAWKIQRNMLNVGVDVWHYKPVSLDKIIWQHNSIKTYYDKNAFAAEFSTNSKTCDIIRYGKSI